MCGEQENRPNHVGRILGSSPRVRGTAISTSMCSSHRGIIPACAGNSRPTAQPRCRKRDHPRVCGEQGSPSPVTPETTGSSPRVRGTDNKERFDIDVPGIIPACAGNSLAHYVATLCNRDHPRVCGEQSLIIALG